MVAQHRSRKQMHDCPVVRRFAWHSPLWKECGGREVLGAHPHKPRWYCRPVRQTASCSRTEFGSCVDNGQTHAAQWVAKARRRCGGVVVPRRRLLHPVPRRQIPRRSFYIDYHLCVDDRTRAKRDSTGCFADASAKASSQPGTQWPEYLLAALVPVAVTWLFVFIVVRAVRWVRAGFASRSG